MKNGEGALPILLELTRRLAAESDLDAQLREITDAALALVRAEHASVRLFDETRTQLQSYARSGRGEERAPVPFKRGEGLIGAVAESATPALVHDTRTDVRFLTSADQGFEVRSLVAAPLIGAGEVIGVLSVSSPEVGSFTEDDRDLVQLLANCAVPAVEKSRLARLAITDWLTRTYNHRYLGPRLSEEIERARRHGSPLAIALIDLDHFKEVNDRLGHDAGDEVLRGVVERIKSEVRRHDVLVRRGGEEFLLVMPETAGAEAAVVAERVRSRVGSEPLRADTEAVPVTVSIGVAQWRNELPEVLEQRVDAAMYRAKRGGRNQVVVD